jgi:hypothetical protein
MVMLTVEALFGAKARLLKAAIDVAIAGDDEPVPVLDRSWAADAMAAGTVVELLSIVAGVIGPAQARSAGLVLDPAVFDRLTRQRHWTQEHYQGWFASSLRRLLVADTPRREST